MIQTYHNQNALQRKLTAYGRTINRFFHPKDCGLEQYTPALSKFRLAIASTWIGICLFTAGTSWTIPFRNYAIVRWAVA